ncbi:hypothetical protein ABPG74_019468 [Tetrahymena malaccensis]
MNAQIVSIQPRNARGADMNSQISSISSQSRQLQDQQNHLNQRNQQSDQRRNQIAGSQSISSNRSQGNNSARNGNRGGSVLNSERGSELHFNAGRNQRSLASNRISGVIGVGIQNGNGSNFSRNNSYQRSISQQQNNTQNRPNRVASLQYSENLSIFHENTFVNQIYNQEWEYRTFVHYFELVYHQVMICLFAFLMATVFLYNMSYAIPMVQFFAYDIISIIRSSYRLTLYSSQKNRIKCRIIMLEIFCLIVAKILAIIYIQAQLFYSLFTMIPISVYCLLRIIIYKMERKSEDCNSLINFFLLGFRLFILLFSFSVCLKMDKYVDWNWQQTFWSYWIIFSVMVGIVFGSFLMLLSKLFQVCLNEAQTFELRGIFWSFYNVAGITAGSCLFLFGLVEYLDNNEKKQLQIFVYFILGYFVTYVVFSSYWRTSILQNQKQIQINFTFFYQNQLNEYKQRFYLKSMSSFDTEFVRKQYMQKIEQNTQQNVDPIQANQNANDVELNDNGQQNEQQNQQQNQDDEDKEKAENKSEKQIEQPLFIPRFLEKLTNTFFKKTDPKMNPNEYFKQKQKEKQQKEEQKKQKTQPKKQQPKKANKDEDQSQKNQIVLTNSNSNNTKKNLVDKNHGRSASSIVFDYSSFSQSSGNKFGFANELITSLKKGANNIIQNMHFKRPSQNGISLTAQDSNNSNPGNRNDKILLPFTESDELNLNQNKESKDCVLEFETQESEREDFNQKNGIPSQRNKEQHVSIIDNPLQAENNQNIINNNNQNQQNLNIQQNNNKKMYQNQLQKNNDDINNEQQQQMQQNQIELIQHNSDDEGQLNTIIEEKSILDQTNNNNIINKAQKRERNLSQCDAYQNNQGIPSIQNIPHSPKNYQFGKTQNNPLINDQKKRDDEVLLQNTNAISNNNNNNNNQHRRFLSAQFTSQMNFNRQQSLKNDNPDSTNKLPLPPFEEENSICDQSQQSKCQQDQSSMMSCSRMDKSANTCLVCFDKQPDSVFMDCGHGGVCYECSLEIWKKTGECYLCRLKIVQVLQVDLKSKVYGLMKVISSTQMVQREVDDSQQSSQPPLEEIEEDVQEQD